MMRYALIRLAHSVPLLLGVVILVFSVMQLIPGDPVQAIVGDYPVPPDFRTAIEAQYHLNDPVWLRLYSYLSNLLRGDLGYSFRAQQPVLDMLLERAGRTLLLAGSGYLVGIVVGVAIGIWGAVTESKLVDRAITAIVLVGYAIPSFWLGQLLVIVFAMHLNWLPTQGMGPLFSTETGIHLLAERARYLVLPAATYAIYEGTRVARLIRASATETLGQGYLITARQKGLSRTEIIRGHVIRNSILPVVTAMGYSFGTAMGGTVLIEAVFSWPGIGLLLVESVHFRDNQVIVGIVLFVSISVVFLNLLVDLLYPLIDPRIRLVHR